MKTFSDTYKSKKYIYNNNNILLFCINSKNNSSKYSDNIINIAKKICKTDLDIIYHFLITNNNINNIFAFYKKKIKNIINKQKYKKIILMGINITTLLIIELAKYTMDDCIYIINNEYIGYDCGLSNEILNKNKLNGNITINNIKNILNIFIKYYYNTKYSYSSEYKILTNKNNLIIAFTDFINNKNHSFNNLNTEYININKIKYISDIIFIQDINNSYFTKGIYGITNNINSTIEYIHNIIKKYKNVVFIGDNNSSYPAMFYGSLLNVNMVIVTNPIYNIDTKLLNIENKYSNVNNFFNTKTEYYIYNNILKQKCKNSSNNNNVNINYININNLSEFYNSDIIMKLYKKNFTYNYKNNAKFIN